MRRVHKKSFLVGFVVSIFFEFVPQFIKPLGNFTETFYNSLIAIFPFLAFSSMLSYFIPIFILSLPFFIIFIFPAWFYKPSKAAANKSSFFILSFLSFLFGSIAAYVIFLIFLIFAVSQWTWSFS
jgi:hypothetical protein